MKFGVDKNAKFYIHIIVIRHTNLQTAPVYVWMKGYRVYWILRLLNLNFNYFKP